MRQFLYLSLVFPFLAVAAGDSRIPGQSLGDEVPTRTIIDVLSDSPQFSTLLQLLQKRELIPLVNSSFNSTFLAPVNSAFAGRDLDSVTESQLLYHFLKDLVLESDIIGGDEVGIVVPSYYDSRDGKGGGHETATPVKIFNGEINNGKSDVLEYDFMASPQRGAVHAISDLLDIPETLCSDLLVLDDELVLFGQLVNVASGVCSSFKSGVTVFAPIEEALESQFEPIEIQYLMSPFGEADRSAMIRGHIVPKILYPQDLPAKVKTMDGLTLEVQRNMSIGYIHVTAGEAVSVSRDGVLAAVDGYLGPSIEFTPQKYIQALGGSKFAHLVSLYGHDHLIDGSHKAPQTVFVPAANGDSTETVSKRDLRQDQMVPTPRDDSSSGEGRWDDVTLYQFVNRQLSFDINDGSNYHKALLETKMPLVSGKYFQKVHFEQRKSGSITLNWQKVLSPQYRIGNTSIYTVEGLLSVPSRLSIALGPLFMSSHSLNFLDLLDLLTLPRHDSWTLFLPTREAWESQTLLKDYLANNIDALSKVFDNFIVNTPIYTDTKPVTTKQFAGYNTTVAVNRDWKTGQKGFSINGTTLSAEITDVLFDNGVAHIVTNFSIPSDLEISCPDLIAAGGRSTFLDMLSAAGLDNIINDRASNYTILVPNINSLKHDNITLDSPVDILQKISSLHIIEGSNLLDTIADGVVVKTIADEEVRVSEVTPGVYTLSFVSGDDQRVLITATGMTNGPVSTGSAVIFIDRYLDPNWINSPLLPPAFRLHPHTILLLGVILGLMSAVVFVIVVIYIFFTDVKGEANGNSRTRRSSEGSQIDPLSPQVPYRDEEEGGQFSGDTTPSVNQSQTQPIRTPAVSEDRAFGRHLELPPN